MSFQNIVVSFFYFQYIFTNKKFQFATAVGLEFLQTDLKAQRVPQICVYLFVSKSVRGLWVDSVHTSVTTRPQGHWPSQAPVSAYLSPAVCSSET